MKLSRLLPILLIPALVLAAAGRPAARIDPAPCEFDGAPRVVAVGDVHGAFTAYQQILRTAGILDGRGRWAGGRTHFVQLGDLVDRGDDSRRVLDLLQKLERDASSAGGRVHVLLGNHEAMRLMGDHRDVSPGEYAAFRTVDSVALRDQVLESYPSGDRAELMRNTPLGMIEMIRAFGPNGVYGTFLRRLNAVVRVNGVMFLHGGLSPTAGTTPCGELNATIRRELNEDLQRTISAPAGSLTARPEGPLWYRGLAEEPETFEPEVDTILAAHQARAIVIAHTVSRTSRIQVRFNGKVFVIDTGLNSTYVKGGRASALEIQDDVFTAIYADKREVLAGPRGGGVP